MIYDIPHYAAAKLHYICRSLLGHTSKADVVVQFGLSLTDRLVKIKRKLK